MASEQPEGEHGEPQLHEAEYSDEKGLVECHGIKTGLFSTFGRNLFSIEPSTALTQFILQVLQ